MLRLSAVEKYDDIPLEYRKTPVGLLLEYHNLSRDFDSHSKAGLLIGMCMDNRKHLKIPDNFAFIIRSGGANLRYSGFKVSFAISIGKVRHIVLIGHTNCGMVNLASKKENFIKGMVEGAGWSEEKATTHFQKYAHQFEIENEVKFVFNEATRLRNCYPLITVVPMLYKVETHKLFLVSASL